MLPPLYYVIYFCKECFLTFKQTPIALIKTIKDVLPALINGSGNPVGGILPVTTAMFINTCTAITVATPVTKRAPNLSFALRAILIKQTINNTKTKMIPIAPTKPSSSPIIEKIKSLSQNGKNKYFCLELKSPTPNQPPEPREYKDWISWKPSPFGEDHGSKNAINLFIRYGSIKINAGTAITAGTPSKTKCFALIPPTNNIIISVIPKHMVMLIFGSKITSRQNKPPTAKGGKSVLKLLTLS